MHVSVKIKPIMVRYEMLVTFTVDPRTLHVEHEKINLLSTQRVTEEGVIIRKTQHGDLRVVRRPRKQT